MEPAFISGFCSAKRMRSNFWLLNPSGRDTNPSKVRPSKRHSFTYTGSMRKLNFLRREKKGHTIIQILAEPGANWKPCGRNQISYQLGHAVGQKKSISMQRRVRNREKFCNYSDKRNNRLKVGPRNFPNLSTALSASSWYFCHSS